MKVNAVNVNKNRVLKATVLWAASLVSMSTLSVYADEFVVENVGFATPESVEYAPAQDTYLVANINGSPFEKDNNGFISRLSPDGKTLDLKWIAGGQNGVTLSAPKGMVAMDDRLYVADIDHIRVFSLPDGKPMASYEIAGSSFLNGVSVASKGGVWVTDSGVAPGFKPAGTDAIYHLSESGKVTTLTKGEDLGRPNGIVETPNKQLVMITIASGQVHHFDLDGKLLSSETLPYNRLDGLVMDEYGELIFSSWTAKAIKKGLDDGEPETIFSDLTSPADIGLDTKRNRVLIPSFMENKVWIKTLP